MLEVIVVEKDALQIIDDYIDCPVGGVPDPFVISAPGCPNPDQHESLIKVWQTGFALVGPKATPGSAGGQKIASSEE